jgi:hypothetical protein
MKFDILREIDKQQVFLSKTAIVFVEIYHDQDAQNPLEDCDGMGRIISLNRRHNNFDSDKVEAILEDPTESKYAVRLSYFEHGNCLWDVQEGERISCCPDMRWDGTRFAGIWIPDSCLREMADEIKDESERDKKLRQWAAQACVAYTEWCNGNCYGYMVHAYKPLKNKQKEVSRSLSVYEEMGEQLEEDSCCGFIGDMDGMIKENILPFVKRWLQPQKKKVKSA